MWACILNYEIWIVFNLIKFGDNCIVFENSTASIGDLMAANWVYWRRVRGFSKTDICDH